MTDEDMLRNLNYVLSHLRTSTVSHCKEYLIGIQDELNRRRHEAQLELGRPITGESRRVF
jgi:hypothetical protein